MIESHSGYCVLKVYVQPGAKKAEISGEYGEPPRIKIKLNAPPVDGSANKALIKFLSDLIGVSKSKIEIFRGHKSREKDLKIECSLGLLREKIKGPQKTP